MIRFSALAVLVFSFHFLFHVFAARSLIVLMRADFIGSWKKGRLISGLSAAFFASESTRSFPSISAWPGIHTIVIWRLGCFSITLSTQSRNSLMTCCPDCLRGVFYL